MTTISPHSFAVGSFAFSAAYGESVRILNIGTEERHKLQKHLYESVTAYVRLGYNQAMQQNRQYFGFLMILMQRLVTSSTQAIATAMECRLEVLKGTNPKSTDEEPPENNIEEQDGQEQLEELLAIRLAGLQTMNLGERRRVQRQFADFLRVEAGNG